jgi:hypothetical protein
MSAVNPPQGIPANPPQLPPPPSAPAEVDAQGQDEKKSETPQPKLFTLKDVKRVIEVSVIWPTVYPGFEPWSFKLRLALSKELEAERQEFLGLPESEAREQTRYRKLVLDQMCYLLTEAPTGFGDMQANGLQTPGATLRDYVEAIKDPDQLETVYRIIIAANNGYWNRCAPQSFSPTI